MVLVIKMMMIEIYAGCSDGDKVDISLPYSCCPEVSSDAKNLASWQGPPANIYVYLVVYSTTSYIYHYFMAPHGDEIDLEQM